MKATLVYRIAAVVLILFAMGHTLGFRKVDPHWGIDGIVASMQAVHFDVHGVTRTYWDFYVGFGLFVSVLLVFVALVCWQFGRLDAPTLRGMGLLNWGLAACFAANTYLCWRYFFPVPMVFSIVLTVLLALAAWLAGRAT
jgi:hypothetical protein